ncbi:hypothetical protein [Flavihumibacter profundi]|jgi:hypothetical protein|uniref:hypothetical protein n=1 Tax=Flavihumibacter profundi TaxID=2716883 RepID=UPI001CC3C20D|nr:hypothetical protein [Flavihumibacter profundi]MBZ5858897.1 hypothetical protein [Flavihumibacter profundi]
MKKNTKTFFSLLLIIPAFLIASCKKEETKTEDLATTKKGWVTGTWKQKDLVLAYPIPNPFGGPDFPVGYSLYNLAPYLPITGPGITCSADNIYAFDSTGNFTITGCTELILPDAGNSGKWNLQVYGSALHLVSTDNKDTPLWINNINSTDMKLGSLSFTIHFAEFGADIPVYILLEK